MSDIVPLHRRGTWQGIINIVFAAGAAIGAPLGGFLADSIGWRWYDFHHMYQNHCQALNADLGHS